MQKRLLILLLCLCAALIAVIALAPAIVANGLRVWIWRQASAQGLQADVGKIEAPLFRPVVIHDVKIENKNARAFALQLSAARIDLDLNLRALFSSGRGHVLRSASLSALTLNLRRDPNAAARFDWNTLHTLLPDDLDLASAQLRIENGATTTEFREVTLSAHTIEAGRFSAREISIVTPSFRKTFAELRGATSWQGERLTLGALTLARGLDLESVTVDLAQLPRRRIGLELKVDAFGGKLRANVSSEERDHTRTWDATGTASQISLAQISDGLELKERANGSLHGCKFTFRGNAADLSRATASVWMDLTGFTWRDRAADTIMLGASLYNRQLQIEQLYVKQRANQFTLSGELPLPKKTSDWLSPDFRGNISAAIKDLGDFARLFGASSADFSGALSIDGTLSARERKLAGHLDLGGKALKLFGAPVDSFNAKVDLRESSLEIAELTIRRKSDELHAAARIDMSSAPDSPKNFVDLPIEGSLRIPAIDLAYAPRIFGREIFRSGILSANISFSGSLAHPRIVGDAQLVDGKLRDVPTNLTSAGGKITFGGDHGTIDFLNVSASNLDLALRGQIDFHDARDLAVTMAAPVLDLTAGGTNCLTSVELVTTGPVLAPPIDQIELRGDLFTNAWKVRLRESAPPAPALNSARDFALCPDAAANGEVLKLGVPVPSETPAPRKRAKRASSSRD